MVALVLRVVVLVERRHRQGGDLQGNIWEVAASGSPLVNLRPPQAFYDPDFQVFGAKECLLNSGPFFPMPGH